VLLDGLREGLRGIVLSLSSRRSVMATMKPQGATVNSQRVPTPGNDSPHMKKPRRGGSIVSQGAAAIGQIDVGPGLNRNKQNTLIWFPIASGER